MSWFPFTSGAESFPSGFQATSLQLISLILKKCSNNKWRLRWKVGEIPCWIQGRGSEKASVARVWVLYHTCEFTSFWLAKSVSPSQITKASLQSPAFHSLTLILSFISQKSFNLTPFFHLHSRLLDLRSVSSFQFRMLVPISNF